MKKRTLQRIVVGTLLLFLGGILFSSWNTSTRMESEEPALTIAVSIPPYVQLVESVAGVSVNVFSIVPSGYSPETYEPTAREVQDLATADVLIFNGNLGYEVALASRVEAVNPDAKIVYLNTALLEEDMLHLEEHGHEEDDHEDEDDAEETLDPHTWLSPRLVSQQIPLIEAALSESNPELSQQYAQNAAAVMQSLNQVSQDVSKKLAPQSGSAFLVYHPAFGYFAKEFGLRQLYIEVEGKEPSAVEMKERIAALSDEEISALFIEPQFASRAAESLASELGLTVQVVDPLSRDYIENIYALADSFTK